MITKTTAANFDEFYAPRFKEITKALNDAGYVGDKYEITSLEKYFGAITEIGSLPTNYDATGEVAIGKYLIVPFDEPYFEIDANTRTITVPEHFKKYGVGVSGDNVAEFLVFKIDRYFDHDDLFQKKIAINWSFTPKSSRLPIYGTPRRAFAPDDELEPGYVVFGMPIVKEMAQDADGKLSSGTLTFSITFYSDDGDPAYAYSFNTIPVSVAINEGLELKNPEAIDDTFNRNLIARLKASSYTPDGIVPLDTPHWLTGDFIVDPVSGNNIYLGLPKELNFHMNDDGTEDEDLVLSAQAYSDALSTIRYMWFSGFDADNVLSARPIDSFAESTDFMPTEDEEPVEGKSYYINVKEIAGEDARNAAFDDLSKVILEIANGEAKITKDSEAMPAHYYYEHIDGLDNMVRVSDAKTLEALFIDGLTEYELGTSYTVKQAGTYSVRAQAVKEIHQTTGTIPAEDIDDGSLKIKVNKLAAAPADVNNAASQANQNAISILQEGHNVVVTGKIEDLNSFASTNPAQGTKKWIGLDLQTNLDDITKLTWNGYALTQADVDEAASVDLGAGHIIFWVGAEDIENSPREIRIAKSGVDPVILKVSFADSALTNVFKTLITENNIANIQQDNVIQVTSSSIDSNICTVPAAAVPQVVLSVETTLEDDFDIINPEAAEGLTYISSDSVPNIIATVTSSNEQPLGAIALEALAVDNIPELTAEQIEANTKSEANPEGKYEFELLPEGQKQVNTDGVVTEGSYIVRAINRRNHTYAISEPSMVVRTSFVAPFVNAVTVKTVDGGSEVILVDKGLAPVNPDNPEERKNAFIRLNSAYPSRRFTIVDESENNIEGAETTYIMEEVIRLASGGYAKKDPADEEDGIVEYEIVDNACTVSDEGLYRVRIENVYNGTRRVAYTDVFEVLRLV